MPFDILSARKEGYSDEEIKGYLNSFIDVNGAISEGYSLDEISSFVSSRQQTPKPQPQPQETISLFDKNKNPFAIDQKPILDKQVSQKPYLPTGEAYLPVKTGSEATATANTISYPAPTNPQDVFKPVNKPRVPSTSESILSGVTNVAGGILKKISKPSSGYVDETNPDEVARYTRGREIVDQVEALAQERYLKRPNAAEAYDAYWKSLTPEQKGDYTFARQKVLKSEADKTSSPLLEKVEKKLSPVEEKVKEKAGELSKQAFSIADALASTEEQAQGIREKIIRMNQYNPDLANAWERGDIGLAIDLLGAQAAARGDQKSIDDVQQIKNEFEKRASETPAKKKDFFNKTLNQTVEMLPALIKGGAMAAIPGVGPLTSTAMWAAQGAGNTFNNLIADGVDSETASNVSAVVGPIYAGIEQLQLGQLTRVPAVKEAIEKGITSAIKKGLTQYGKDWAKEVNEEGLQGVVQTVGEEYAKGKDPEAIASSAMKSYIDNVAQSAAPMALLGLPAKAGGVIRNISERKEDRNPQNNQISQIESEKIDTQKAIVPTGTPELKAPEQPEQLNQSTGGESSLQEEPIKTVSEGPKKLSDFKLTEEEFWNSDDTTRNSIYKELDPQEQKRVLEWEKPEVNNEVEEIKKKILEYDRPPEHQEEMKNVNVSPTEGQKDAGNYRKAHIKREGFEISIENPAGSTRNGVDRDGRAWSQPINHDYGYIRGTVGKDKDHVDVFIKPGSPEGGNAYIVNQVDPKSGNFDEHKVMLGFENENEAREAYLSNYEPGWKGLKNIIEMPMEKFKEWVFTSATKKEAVSLEPPEIKTNNNKGENTDGKSQETETLLTQKQELPSRAEPVSVKTGYSLPVEKAAKIIERYNRTGPDIAKVIAEEISDAITEKDPEILEKHLAKKGNSRGERAAFKILTGVDIPSMIPDARVAIMKYVGDEAYRNFNRARVDKLKKKNNDVSNERFVHPLLEKTITYKNPETKKETLTTWKSLIQDRVISGYSNIEEFKSGPQGKNTRYKLINPETKKALVLPEKEYVDYARELIEKKKVDTNKKTNAGENRPVKKEPKVWFLDSNDNPYLEMDGMFGGGLTEPPGGMTQSEAQAESKRRKEHKKKVDNRAPIEYTIEKGDMQNGQKENGTGQGNNERQGKEVGSTITQTSARKTRKEAKVKKTLSAEKYTSEYDKEYFLHLLNVNTYNALSGGWRHNGVDYSGSYDGWMNDYNILTDAKTAKQFKKGTITDKGKKYLQSIVDGYQNDNNAQELLQEIGLDTPEHIDDVRAWLEQSKNAKEFTEYHKNFEKQIQSDNSEDEFITQKKVDEEVKRRQEELNKKKRENILQDTPLFDANEREARATKQENLFSSGEKTNETPSKSKNESGRTSDTDAINELNKAFQEKYGIETGIDSVNPDSEAHKAAKIIAKTFGSDLVWFSPSQKLISAMGSSFGGVFVRDNPKLENTIFINQVTEKPVLQVVGHELLHRMDAKYPDLYNVLEQTFIDEANAKAQKKIHSLVINERLDERQAREEVIADFVGDEFASKSFWDKLYERSPDAFKAAVQIIREVISKALKVLRIGNYSDSTIFNDAQRVKDVLIDVIKEYGKRESGEKAEKKNALPLSIEKNKSVITDFGEKIGGARKDYAQKLTDASKLDIATHSLSEVWPEPDYEKLVKNGIDPFIVGFIRAARDEVPPKPQKSWKLHDYIDTVKTLRSFSEGLLSGQMEKKPLLELLNSQKYYGIKDVKGRAELYELFGHEISLKGVTLEKHHYAFYNGEKNVTKWIIEKQLLRQKTSIFGNMPRELGSGNTKEEAIESFKRNIQALKPETEKNIKFDIYSYRKDPKTFIIGKKMATGQADLFKFDQYKTAKEFLRDHYDEVAARFEAFKRIGNERRSENAPRIGEDYRKGKDVTPEMFQEAFGFRGVEFGNYVEQGRRQTDLNESYDALMDLASILNIPSRAVSLSGELGLAFGARGIGGKNAPLAHYERNKVVINLTKKNGPGSLAHEWWHALDNYFARLGGNKDEMATNLSPVRIASYGTSAPFETFGRGLDLREEMVRAFGNILKVTKESDLPKRSEELDRRRTSPYWSLTHEMAARAFENYVIERLSALKMQNDYLANISNAKEWANDMIESFLEGKSALDSYPYLTESEVVPFTEAFDNFFQTLKTKEGENGNIILFSKETADITEDINRFSKIVDTFVSGKKITLAILPVLRTTPDIILRTGAKRYPVTISLSVMAKIVEGKYDRDGLPLKTIKDLPRALSNPVAVFKSDTQDNSLVVVTDLLDSKGNKVIVAIYLDDKNRLNAIKSVYGKDRKSWFQEQIDKGNLLYVDETKKPSLLQSNGLQLPQATKEKASIQNISKNKPNVNSSFDIRFSKESPLSSSESIREAKSNIEDRLKKSLYFQKTINSLRYKFRTIPEESIEKRALIEVQINRAKEQELDEIKTAIYEYAAKIGLKGVPYNKVDTLLKNIDTIGGLKKAITVMDEVYSRAYRREKRDEVLELIRKKNQKLNKLSNAKIPSITDLEANRKLQEYLDKLVGVTDKFEEAKLRKILTWLNRDAPKIIERTDRADLPVSVVEWVEDPTRPMPSVIEDAVKGLYAKTIDKMTVDQLQTVIDDIKSIEETGRTRREEQERIRKETEEKAIENMAAEIIKKNPEPSKKLIRGESFEEWKNRPGKYMDILQHLPWHVRDIDRIIVALTGKTSGTALEEHVLKPLAKAQSEFKRGMGQVNDFIQKTYGKLDMEKIRKEPWKTIQINFKHDDGRIETQEMTITLEEGMHIYANSMNPSQLEHELATINRSDRSNAVEIMNNVISYLPKELIKAVNDQWEYYDKNQWERMNAVFADAHQVDMGHEPYYMPATNLERAGATENIEADLLARAISQASSDIGSTKNRIVSGTTITAAENSSGAVSAAPFKHRRYFDVVIPSLREAEHYIAFYKPVWQVNRYLNNQTMIDALTAHDKAVIPVLKDWLKSLAYGKWTYGESQNWLNKAIRILRLNAGAYQILGRVTSLLLQASSLPRGFITTNPKYLISSVGTMLRNPADFWHLIELKSPEMKTRTQDWEQAISEWLDGVEGKKLIAKLNPIDKAKEFLGALIGNYDKFWASLIWFSRYSEALNRGFSEEGAIYEADKIVRKTQSGGGLLAANSLQRGSDLERAFTQFLSDAVKAANTLDETIQGWKSLSSAQRSTYIIFGLLLPGIMTHIVRTGGEPWKDPEGVVKELIGQVTGAVPILGQLIDLVTTLSMDWVKTLRGLVPNKKAWDYVGELEAPAIAMIGDISKNITTGIKTKDLKKKILYFVDAIAMATGLPGGGQLKRTVTGIEDLKSEGDPRYLVLPKAAVAKPKYAMVELLKNAKTWQDKKKFLTRYSSLSSEAQSKFLTRASEALGISEGAVRQEIVKTQIEYHTAGKQFGKKRASLYKKYALGEINKKEMELKLRELEADQKAYIKSLK